MTKTGTRSFVRFSVVLAAVCALVHTRTARSEQDPPGTLQSEAVVNASLDEAWAAYTTQEGVTSWMVPVAEVDFRFGGTLKTNYNAKAKIGDEGTIVHHILAYEPKRMFAMRFDAPGTNPVTKIAEKAWWVTRFEPVTSDRTRVTVTMCGWGEGDDWDKARAFFEKGNDWEMKQLQKHFDIAKAAKRDEQIMRELHKLVGGDWVYENKGADGQVFRARSRWEAGPDEQTLHSLTWLGDDDGLFLHSSVFVWREPDRDANGGIRFRCVQETGAIASGAVRLNNDGSLVWDWDSRDPNARLTRYRVQTKLVTPDKLHFEVVLLSNTGKAAKELVKLDYAHVDEAPARYKKLKSAQAPATADVNGKGGESTKPRK